MGIDRRVHRDEAAWREIFARQEASGLRRSQFCRQEGINPGVFRRWREKLNGEARGPTRRSRTGSKVAAPFIDMGALQTTRSRWEVQWHSTGCTDRSEAERHLAEYVLRHEELDRERLEDVPLLAVLDRYLHITTRVTRRASRRRRRTKKGRPVLPIGDTLLHWLKQSGPGYVIQWKKLQAQPLGRIQTAFEAARRRAGLGARPVFEMVTICLRTNDAAI